jgi:hypothetical protein
MPRGELLEYCEGNWAEERVEALPEDKWKADPGVVTVDAYGDRFGQ